MINTMRQTVLVAALALASLQVHAATYVFTGQLETGPLAGQGFSGGFSYEDQLLAGVGSEYLNLTSWALNVLGQAYSADTVIASPQAAFWDGQFVGLNATFTSGPYAVTFADGFVDFGGAYLGYSTPAGEGFGSYAVSAVPEPAALSLSVLGLAALGLIARRRRQALASAG